VTANLFAEYLNEKHKSIVDIVKDRSDRSISNWMRETTTSLEDLQNIEKAIESVEASVSIMWPSTRSIVF